MCEGSVLKDYYFRRQKKGSFRYRLQRRSLEVSQSINRYCSSANRISILDIGTSEGLMLEQLSCSANIVAPFLVGIDVSFEMLKANPNCSFHPVQADALKLPFPPEIFDVTIATAIIEHVSDGSRLLKESYRVLKPGGLCILTTPVPFFDRIYALFAPGERRLHYGRFALRKLKASFDDAEFQVIKAEKFMMSPFGFPGEKIIEKIMKKIGFDFLLLNQIVAGRKAF